MIISLDEAKDILRVDGNELDDTISSLVEAIPSYLEVTTGKAWDDEPVNPLAETTAKFVLMLWFAPDSKEVEKLKRTIDGLLTGLTAMARG